MATAAAAAAAAVATIDATDADPVSTADKYVVDDSRAAAATVAANSMGAIRKTWFASGMLRASSFADAVINFGGASSIMLLSLPLMLPSMPLP